MPRSAACVEHKHYLRRDTRTWLRHRCRGGSLRQGSEARSPLSGKSLVAMTRPFWFSFVLVFRKCRSRAARIGKPRVAAWSRCCDDLIAAVVARFFHPRFAAKHPSRDLVSFPCIGVRLHAHVVWKTPLRFRGARVANCHREFRWWCRGTCLRGTARVIRYTAYCVVIASH